MTWGVERTEKRKEDQGVNLDCCQAVEQDLGVLAVMWTAVCNEKPTQTFSPISEH
jgi:hypothetical protein